MLIRNYGLFWRLDQVYWGKPNDSGSLLGRQAAKSNAVDFREQRGVYVLYDDGFKIIYIGQAGRGKKRLFKRLHKHKRDHLAQRWSRFSWFGLCPVVNGKIDVDFEPTIPSIEDLLNHIEGILLAAAEPPLNLQRGRFKRVQKFIQIPLDKQQDWRNEEDVGPDEVEDDDPEADT